MSKILANEQFRRWQKSGRKVPVPLLLKQSVITEYQEKFGCSVFIETGTYLGDMVEAQKRRFKKVISIELGVKLAENAQKRFRNDKHVAIVQGDSSKMLALVLAEIDEPAVFFLDGHYSSGLTSRGEKICPIFEELETIFGTKKFNHIILIDDARLYNGTDNYPSVEELREFVKNRNDSYRNEIEHDIIRFLI